MEAERGRSQLKHHPMVLPPLRLGHARAPPRSWSGALSGINRHANRSGWGRRQNTVPPAAPGAGAPQKRSHVVAGAPGGDTRAPACAAANDRCTTPAGEAATGWASSVGKLPRPQPTLIEHDFLLKKWPRIIFACTEVVKKPRCDSGEKTRQASRAKTNDRCALIASR